ncbi:MAG TPA: sigma-54 dependent transcriptional regulator [Candidatus Deferrimicrobium sp.]|nr:sigma-54 dependent transcriptional regulator [Candidatus Deferrimicrobium sp.]
MAIKLLLIEDEVTLRKSLGKLLQLKQYEVDLAEDFKTAVKKIRYANYDIFLLDLKLPDGNGIDLLKSYSAKMEGKTIVMTAHATIPSAVDAIQSGAFYYLEKPLDEELLFIQMEKIKELTELKEKNLSFKNELTSEHSSQDIIYKSSKMAEVLSTARQFSKTDNTVLILGQTGVGKELMAQFIHKNSKRKDKTFLPINCSSIPEQLFESELFGFKKGAFTGASDNYSGRFLQADKGTIFLDEIGEIPIHLQAKLLRILEDESIYQLGNNSPVKIDVRVLAATNKDLWKEVQADRFRKDLYFRLKEAIIEIPPLKERKEDIMLLIWHFIGLYNSLFDKKITRITKEAELFLKEYPWEGNVRELKNSIKSIFSLKNTNSITINDLMISLHGSEKKDEKSCVTLQEYELKYVKEVLELTDFNIKKTAEILDVSRARLYRKIKLLNLDIKLDESLDQETEDV